MIYLDHAATTPVCPDAVKAMLPYLSDDYANASGSYGSARKARRAVDRARDQVAAALGAKRQEIVFTSGGTESDNWALCSAVKATGKRRIVTTHIEHHAVLHTCDALEKEGIEVIRVLPDAYGVVDPQHICAVMNDQTALVSVMLANNEVGTIQPIADIARIAHDYGAVMHTDAVQAVGHIPVSVDELGVDLLSLSAHKFGGMKGVGALYIRSGTKMVNLIHGGAQERGLRAGTENVPGIVCMGEAIASSLSCMDETAKQISAMRDRFEARLTQVLPQIRVNAQRAIRLPGHSHVTIPNADAALLLMLLDMEGIAASSASACAAGAMERSHVMTAMGVVGENEADLRFTFGAGNTMDEIERVVAALGRILTI